MLKNSLSLFETLVSLIILFVVISYFSKITYEANGIEDYFTLINQLDNNFNIKDYSKFKEGTKTLQIIKNFSQIEEILVKKYEYQDENIKVFIYEK